MSRPAKITLPTIPTSNWYRGIELLPGQEWRRNKIYQKISGWDVLTPPIPENIEEVVNWNLPVKDQKFRRTVHPVYMEKKNWEYAKGDKESPIWTAQQRAYRDAEKRKIFVTGVWILIKGIPMWIHGYHYFGLNYWHVDAETEDGYKEFRQRDVERWLVWKIVEDSQTEFGLLYLKHRRDGASIDGWIKMYLTAQTGPGKKCGHTNFTEDDAKEAFQTMGIKPMLKVPLWLQPKHNAKPNSLTVDFTSYTRGTQNKQKISENVAESLNSLMMYKATKEDPFDGKKMGLVFPDELAKLPKLNLSDFLSTQMQALSQGYGTVKVGNMYCPSTTGGDEKASEQYREVFKMSLPEAYSEEMGRTSSGLRAYFDRASHGLEGYIDEYGFSIEYDPTPEQLEFMRKRYPGRKRYVGARQHIVDTLAMHLKAGNFKKYYEDKRLFPLTIHDPFSLQSDAQQFNSLKLENLKFYIMANNFLHKNLVRTGDFFWYDDHTRQRVEWRDNPRGKFEVSLIFSDPAKHNRVRFDGELAFPMNDQWGCISLDPYAKGQIQNKSTGSKGAAHGIVFFSAQAEEEKYLPGGYDNPNYYPSPGLYLKYKARPIAMDEFYEDILMACHFYSVKLAFEANIYAIHEYFIKRGYQGFLYKTYEFKDKVLEKISDADYQQYGYRVAQQDDQLISDISLLARFIEGQDIVYCGWDYDIVSASGMKRIPFLETIEDLLRFENDKKVRTKCDLTMSLIPGFKINSLRMKKSFYGNGDRGRVSNESVSAIFSRLQDVLVS